MPATLSKSKEEVLTALRDAARQHHLHLKTIDKDGIRGELEETRSRWFLGGCSVRYDMACLVDETARAVHYRESIKESSWGIPLPLFMAERTRQVGTTVSESRTAACGGVLEFEHIREALEQAARGAGWRFTLEPGRTP